MKQGFATLAGRTLYGELNEVFKNEESQKKINEIIHPIISDLIIKRINDKKNTHPLFVIDAALIIESGMFKEHTKNGSKLILIIADKNLRLKRALSRGNLSKQTIKDRMKLQMEDNQKMSKADLVNKNNSTKSELYSNIDEIIEKITHE